MKYQELKEGIEHKLRSAAEDFFMIGYYLRQISENALFLEDGYATIWEFAKCEYGLSISATSRYIAINNRFSSDGGQTMQQKYIGMGVSKLQEMLTLSDEELETVTQNTTVKELRAIKAAKKPKLSAYGWPAKVYPPDSLLSEPGCAPEHGFGGHACFSCSQRNCEIRQKKRLCYVSTTIENRPCSFSDDMLETVKVRSVNRDRCLHLHPELAAKRAGDGMPRTCCLFCEAYKEGACNNCCCDVAKAEIIKKRKEQENEISHQFMDIRKQKSYTEAPSAVIDADHVEVSYSEPVPETEPEKKPVYEEIIADTEESINTWKQYQMSDVKILLDEHKRTLEMYEDIQAEALAEYKRSGKYIGLPSSTLTKAQILVDALEMLYDRRTCADDNDDGIQ